MPVPLRTMYHKAEAKYNVTTEFPSLGLHSAAATGNVGLVEYALDHGQPINSVLDGVLPLHAACAGGNVQVVKLLIDHGADVNAPRLPRRYSNDKNRDSSAPIVGTSGSTPLHFAAANGNRDVVTLLLLHGAHADRADKHGVTPETLARQNGWIECAKVLNTWILNKDRDLKEREGLGPDDGSRSVNASTSHSGASDAVSSPAPRSRRLHVKQSIDTALNMLKSSSTGLSDAYRSHYQLNTTPPASPQKPFGEYSFYPYEGQDTSIDPGTRRPSLPQVLQPQSDDILRHRKSSASSNNNSKVQRPRSAGTDAEQQQEQPNPIQSRAPARRLGSKYSLMNIFKKGQVPDGGSGSAYVPDDDSSRHGTSASTFIPPSQSPQRSSDQGEGPSSTNTPPAASGSSFSLPGLRFRGGSDASTRTSPLVNQVQPPSSQPLHRKLSSSLRSQSRAGVSEINQQTSRDRSKSAGTPDISEVSSNLRNNSPGSSPLARLKVLRSQDRSRDRSGSSGSLTATDLVFPDRSSALAEEDSGSLQLIDTEGKPGVRPGILRAHGRTSSGGNSSGSPAAFRALRFDATSESGERRARDGYSDSPRGPQSSLRPSISAGSLSRNRNQSGEKVPLPHQDSSEDKMDPEAARGIEEEDEFEFGQPIGDASFEPESADALLLRQRGRSFASSSQSSLSPILSNDTGAGDSAALKTEFPFSINRPPELDIDNENALPPTTTTELLNVPIDLDNRDRGNSMSSTDSQPQLSFSNTTAGSDDSVKVSLPHGYGILDVPIMSSPRQKSALLDQHVVDNLSGSLNERRAHSPLDINIGSISSHAQAEALVERTRQEVLEMGIVQELSQGLPNSARSQLSARLAAYGESLALERKLREQKEAEIAAGMAEIGTPTSQKLPPKASLLSLSTKSDGVPARATDLKGRGGVERQLSLESRTTAPGSRPRLKSPRRPSTAEGIASRTANNSFSSELSGESHQSSRSTSAVGYSQSDQHISNNATTEDQSEMPQRPLYRSLTPNPDMEPETLSRISSLDGLDTDTDTEHALIRVSTAPLSGPTSMRGKREQVKSAKKLTRMGFAASEQAGRNPPSSNKRFGAIKSLMQSLKGKA